MRWLSRSTVFAAFFTITSFILALKGLLTGQYVAMCSAIQGYVVARAVAEDYHERNKKDDSECQKSPL
jgi:hypothetical protein